MGRRYRLPPWSWHGLVAVILAVSIAGSYAVVLVITAVQEGPVTPEGAALLNNLGSMLAGALAGWLGGSAVTAAQRQQHEVDQDTGPYVEPEPEPTERTAFSSDAETEGEV